MKPVFFISDLHLDPSRPAINNLFLAFLRQRAREASALYILGDLFEAWIGDDDPEPAYQEVKQQLQCLHASGVDLYFIAGNRDFLIGEDFSRQTGCRRLPDSTVIDLFGTPALIMHGDSLCTDDREYQQFRAQVRDPQWQRDFLAKPIAERNAIARQLREISQQRTRDKAEYITDVNPDAVREAMTTAGVRRLIHGHTHRPAIHDFQLQQAPAQRMVLGDWYEQGSLLICEPQGCRLERMEIPFQSSQPPQP